MCVVAPPQGFSDCAGPRMPKPAVGGRSRATEGPNLCFMFKFECRNGGAVTQFSLTDVRPVGSINDELGVLTDFLERKRESV